MLAIHDERDDSRHWRGYLWYHEQDTESLDGSRMQEAVSSIVVHDGTWQLCSRPGFEGRCRTFEPGRYGTLAGMDDRIASARLMR